MRAKCPSSDRGVYHPTLRRDSQLTELHNDLKTVQYVFNYLAGVGSYPTLASGASRGLIGELRLRVYAESITYSLAPSRIFGTRDWQWRKPFYRQLSQMRA